MFKKPNNSISFRFATFWPEKVLNVLKKHEYFKESMQNFQQMIKVIIIISGNLKV